MAAKRRAKGAWAIALLLSGCSQFDEPRALDAGPYLGCYSLDGLTVRLTLQNAIVGGRSFPLKIEQRKVGVGLLSPFVIVRTGDQFLSQAADEHFYRFSSEDGQRILITTDQQSYVYSLRKQTCQ